ncbi:hypothetical protein D9Q98_005201 [Chlorella vulgaris]|uniref:ApaG domain-containing protein n=1 Tax=Chlorella vulgaris TaxID=3077 RepID=A0A9D4TPZ9_CHLVU|nr:hypothetical protein D9Q98_005201 [Chlorella vulgaris]
MSSRAVRALYRLLLRQARDLERQGVAALDIRMPLNKEAWLFEGGSHSWAAPRDIYRLESLRTLAPWAAKGVASGSLPPPELRALVSRCFRHPPASSSREEQLDRAFLSLRLLSEQVHMHCHCSSSCETEGVDVEVTTGYVGNQRDLDPTFEAEEGAEEGADGNTYFTYRIRVSNCGLPREEKQTEAVTADRAAHKQASGARLEASEETVQLLGRHWLIYDSRGVLIHEVPKGTSGVVGCTPLLEPGACFEYYSGVDLSEPAGSLRGSFQMAVVNPSKPHDKWIRTFDAEVAPVAFVATGGAA